MSERNLNQVHIIGCGLIGTSMALELTSLGVRVSLDDSNSQHLETAMRLGAGFSEVLDSPDLVIVAVPPSKVAEVVISSLERFSSSVVMDVASVKNQILKSIQVSSVDTTRFISTHPMAGSEQSGPEHARRDLFRGKVWAVIEKPTKTPATLLEILQLLGAKAVYLSAEQHDRAVALTSHTPQLLASILAGMIADSEESDFSLSGQALQDMIRIAASDANLWAEILVMNSANLLSNIDLFIEQLTWLANLLEKTDTESAKAEIFKLIQQGNLGVARLQTQLMERNKS